jgi:hypothetical protein
MEIVEQLINIDAGRQFMVSKAHHPKARNRYGHIMSEQN